MTNSLFPNVGGGGGDGSMLQGRLQGCFRKERDREDI